MTEREKTAAAAKSAAVGMYRQGLVQRAKVELFRSKKLHEHAENLGRSLNNVRTCLDTIEAAGWNREVFGGETRFNGRWPSRGLP
jgi:hypothetical protein